MSRLLRRLQRLKRHREIEGDFAPSTGSDVVSALIQLFDLRVMRDSLRMIDNG